MIQADKVYLTLGHWARIPTWHTGHAADEKRFREAMLMLLEDFGTAISEDDVRAALYRYRDESPELLGGKASDGEVEMFVRRTMGALKLADLRSVR